MASKTTQRRIQKSTGVAASLLIHVMMLIVLVWVRAPPATDLVPPIDISLVPPLEEYSLSSAGSPGGGSPGGGGGQPGALRRLSESPAGGGQPAKVEKAVRPTAPQNPSVQSARVAEQPELRPAQSLAQVEPVEEPAPAKLADRVAPETQQVTAAVRTPARPVLRPVQGLPAPAEETPPAKLADRVAPQTNQLTAAAPSPTRPTLRPAQGLALQEEEAPPAKLAGRVAPQTQQATAANRPTPAGQLRPVQGLAAPQEEGPPAKLAERVAPQTNSLTAAAPRPGPAPRLQPAQGLASNQPAQSGAPAATPGASPSQQTAQGPAGQPSVGPPGARPGPPGPGLAAGGPGGAGNGPHPGCEPEVLMLLTPAERERCRNQIDSANARRANANAGRDAAQRVQTARGMGWLDGIAPDKRAYYDAVVAAKDQVYNQAGGGKPPGLSCNFAGLFGGVSGQTREKIKIPGVPCVFVPPQGVLTEEARIKPP